MKEYIVVIDRKGNRFVINSSIVLPGGSPKLYEFVKKWGTLEVKQLDSWLAKDKQVGEHLALINGDAFFVFGTD